MKEVEKRGQLSISFPFKYVTDNANFSDYKWPRTFPGEKKNERDAISENN